MTVVSAQRVKMQDICNVNQPHREAFTCKYKPGAGKYKNHKRHILGCRKATDAERIKFFGLVYGVSAAPEVEQRKKADYYVACLFYLAFAVLLYFNHTSGRWYTAYPDQGW